MRKGSSKVVHPLKRISQRVGLELEPLRKATAQKAGLELSITSLQYYWDDKRYKGGVIPENKPWRDALREILMARGMTPEEARELFGNYYDGSEMSELRTAIQRLEQKLDVIVNALERIGAPISTKLPSRIFLPPPDRK